MRKLFYDDAYLHEWESDIVEIIEKDNKYYIVLSETAFYPESGGQPSDVGYIMDNVLMGNKNYEILIIISYQIEGLNFLEK